MAKYVQKRTCATAARQNKGVKQAGFLVLRETSMPSCLIELGFISTPDEEDFLRTDAGVGRLALGIYQAFVDYKQKHAYSPVPVNYQPTQEETIPQVSQPASEDSRPPMDNQRVAEQQTETKQQTVAVPQTVTEQQRAEVSLQQTTATPDRPAKPVEGKPVFKVQILSGTKKLKTTDAQLKGLKDIDYYQEGGLYKYTVGASENYSEIYQLRKTLLARFPQAFIIAFKNGQRTDVQAAIQEYRNNKRKGSK
jgi:N-acetylmuramoyl-L-alanine amidase